MQCVTELRLAVALAGPEGAESLERASLDLLTFSDPADALAAAAVTRRIGLVTTASGPGQILILDDVSLGRAGWLTPSAPSLSTPPAPADPSAGGDSGGEAPALAPGVVIAAEAPDGFGGGTADGGGGGGGAGGGGAGGEAWEAAAREAVARADVVFVRPADAGGVRAAVAAVRAVRAAAGTAEVPYRVFADLRVAFTEPDKAPAAGAGADGTGLTSSSIGDPALFTGPAPRLASLLTAWQRAGADGFRLHPVDPRRDLAGITGGLVPHLRENDAFRRGYEVKTLRALLRVPHLQRVSAPLSAS